MYLNKPVVAVVCSNRFYEISSDFVCTVARYRKMNEINQKNSVEQLLAELFTDHSDDNKSIGPHEVITLLATNEIDCVNNLSGEEFRQLFRMSKENVYALQNEIDEDDSSVQLDTNLLLTLFVLGSSVPLQELSLMLSTTETKLTSTCNAVFERILKLSDRYVVWPSSTEMLTIENLFMSDYNFPSIIGAIGCLHIATRMPEHIPDIPKYYNEDTGYYTIVVQAVCDSNLLFRDLFIGYPGSYSVEEILQASPLYSRLEHDDCLRKMNKHLLGGTEHPQLNSLLTPYPLIDSIRLNDRQMKFNSRHGQAMTVIDKTFKSMESRFERMKCLEYFDVNFVTLAMGTICVLHNYAKIKRDNS